MQLEQLDHKKLQCLYHPQHSLSLLSLSLKCPYNKRFICIGCLLESKYLENVVAFQDFIQDPITFLDINKEYQLFYKQDSYCKTIKLIEELKTIMTKQLSDILQELEILKSKITDLKNKHQPNKEDLLKRLKFDKFCQQYDLVWNMDSYQGTQEYEQLEQQLQDIILNFKDCCHQKSLEIINDQGKSIEDFSLKFQQQIENQFSQQQNVYIQIRTELLKLNVTQNDIRYFVHKEISKDKLVKYDLIYSGSRDSLTLASYWSKCNLQSNLLTIFNLKNGITFGGYSPCQIDMSLRNYVVDSTNSSFLFSYTREEIYRQKNKERTVYCRHDCGPSFGTGMDFYTSKDFSELGSLLGVTFDITGYNVTNKHTHLIGSKDADIIDCKVYKVTFL